MMDAKIFDTLLEPVFILNKQKKVLYCNEPASLMCDLSVRKILRIQPAFDELFRFAEPIAYLQALEQVADPTPYQEVAFSSESGKTGKVQITFQPFSDGESPVWLVFFRDVTLEETLQKKYRAELEQKEGVILDLQKAQAELEKYSKNLERMVDERTAEIKHLNQMMKALLDSLHQGFFIFNSEGICQEVSSKACESTIEARPAGRWIWDVLKLQEGQVPGFKKWILTLFSEMLPFEDLAPLGPQKFPHSAGREIQLEYFPLRTSQGSMDGIVVVASDITKLIEAQKEAETERAHAKMIVSLVQHKKQALNFLQEANALLTELNEELSKNEKARPDQLFRCLHTLKGGAATFSIKSMVDQAHESETLLTEWKNAGSPELFAKLKRSSTEIQHHFHKFSTDNESILGSLERARQRWVEVPAERLKQFQSKLPEALKGDFLREFLMEPVSEFFKQYQEIAFAVAEREMKSLHPLAFHNADLLVLPEIYSQLFSTFIHAYRNAVDHGIESPELRILAGKSPEGSIETTFSLLESSSQKWLLIEVKDDGQGVDPAKIRSRLSAQNKDASKETDQEVIQHIFDSQFSTKETVTEISGRGVGMDAILSAAKALGGKAWVDSISGKGTSLKVQVPYLKDWTQSSRKAA